MDDTEDHLKLFERAILSVLTKTDPKYDLEPEKRWMADEMRERRARLT